MSYINSISQRTSWIFIAKDFEEARHCLKSSDSCRVEAILHIGRRDEAAKEETFSIRPKGRFWYCDVRRHCS